MSTKNILFVIDSLGIGGAEKAILTLANFFLNENCNVDIIVCDNIVQFEMPEQINLHILGFKKSFLDYRKYSHKLEKMISNLQKKYDKDFDLILVHLQKATRLIKNHDQTKVYHVVHSTFSQSAFKNKSPLSVFFKKRKLQNIYNNLNIITVSEGIKKDLLDNIQIRPKSIQRIYNPINKDEITSLADEPIELDDNDYIVHVGRLAKVKRHDVLLKAFKLANINAKLILVGDGEEKSNILTLIKELHLEEKVILKGFQKNPYPYIKNAKLLVLSSEYEGLPTVLLESLILNTPVVSTNCPSGPNEILSDTLHRCLANVNDVEDLANKIRANYLHPTLQPRNTTFHYKKIIQDYLALC